ncbi:MAG: DNA mismatch repair endonuclease MutL [Lachnospiraceae bacterium]|nr:DNA mismatch repair endonuclease MutL [Lachnospiraceae bacterium]
MIKLLDKATIDKIAAGEVIERPFSVVKELLENSIDAGSTSITIEIKEGGLSFIRVTDNGCGIPKDQVKTAYLRHATSKIEQAEDLANIVSLGFRGEALSTIAAVSQTEMITKTPEDLTGVKYTIHGGMEIEFVEVGVPDGTTIIVRNLFYNTPARKKFLKTPMTEGSYIQDLVLKLALSHPDISFRLISNGQTKIDTSGNGKAKDAIYQLFGRDITSNLIEVNYTGDNIKISGYIGKPFISRGNRGLENYFINKRYIKSNVINRAIEEGYKTFVMQHKFPFTVLYIELPPESCDVNVHPTKMEFKYDNERELFEVITKTIRDALTHKEIIPKAEYESKEKSVEKPSIPVPKPAEPFEKKRVLTEIVKETNEKPKSVSSQSDYSNTQMKPQINNKTDKYSPTYKILESLKQAESEDKDSGTNVALNILKDDGVAYTPSVQINNQKSTSLSEKSEASPIKPDQAMAKAISAYKQEVPKQSTMFDDDFLTEKARVKHRLIGQLFDTYWLIQYENNLYIMDQHAAHEKIKYEELLANFNNKEVLSQQLMPPMVITVSYAERQAILDNFDLFMKIGYDIEEFGGNEFKINAVPSNLFGLHGRTMFMEFVSSLINNSGYMSNDVFIKKLSTMACKAAIKGNMRISFAEADALVDQLLKLDNPYTCPHGRPTIISISENELEKKFKRVL